MKLFEKLGFGENKEDPLNGLHPDFRRKYGPWRYNKELGLGEGRFTMKVRVGFDDPFLLDDCQFYAKIGVNLDENIHHKFIGFMYGNEGVKNGLIDWAKKFPYSELIVGLDRDAVSLPNSEVMVINQDNQEMDKLE